MVILGFMLNYALRVNLTIAIVAMVDEPKGTSTHVSNSTSPLTINDTYSYKTHAKEELTSASHTLLTTAAPEPFQNTTDKPATAKASDGFKFKWNTVEQNIILGSFFWGYVLTELPGGRLAELIGGHRVFGHSMLWASVLTLITPCAAFIDYKALVIVRALLGFMLGASWPAIHPMTAVWIPPVDRSKFMANMMASSLGAAAAMPICGFLIEYINWQSTFYFTGGIGLLWSIVWFWIIFETPAVHPRISPEERKEIEDAIGTTTSKKKPTYVPWRSILTAPCVWAIILTHGTSVFGYFTIVNQLPTYMKYILHYDIKSNGLLSSLPYLGKYVMAVLASALADHLRRTGALTTTQTRKIFTTFATMTPGFLMIVQVFLGYDRTWSVIIFTTQLFLNGAVTAGYLGNGLDIAPNFSGTIFGLANTLSSIGGYVSTFMVGTLTADNNTYGQWQIVFGILAASYIFGSLAFLFMGTGELQPWNNPPERINRPIHDTEEALPLKKDNVITSTK
ncbi:sialin isoform X2 [Sitodiplosis mosellana]|nr:sialin isoform X2 [Sitodiplosis mosellana]